MEKTIPHFTIETETVIVRGKSITVTHRTPIFTPEQREKRKREIEVQLYEVCCKYQSA